MHYNPNDNRVRRNENDGRGTFTKERRNTIQSKGTKWYKQNTAVDSTSDCNRLLNGPQKVAQNMQN